jgi:hypothetical protein
MKRSRHIQIYLKPGIREDDQMLSIWEACKRYDRPQDVFRAMLRAGMRAMVQSGEMPFAVVEECNLDAFVDKWLARQPVAAAPKAQAMPAAFERHQHAPAAPAHYYQEAPPAQRELPPVVQQPHQPSQHSAPAPRSEPVVKVAEQSPQKNNASGSENISSPQIASGKRIGNLM